MEISKFNKLFEDIIYTNNNCRYIQDLKKYQICSKYSPYLNLPYIFSIQNDLINEINSVYLYRQIHSYKNYYLINETPTNIANYGNNILQYINNNVNIILSKNDFLNFIPKSWEYYNKFLNTKNIKLYIFKFDFENIETNNFSLVDDILKKFYTVQQLGIFALNKKLHEKQFKQENQLSTGGTMPSIYRNILNENICLMYLNTNIKLHHNKTTINHELFHYMQNILHIDLLKDVYSAPSYTDKTILNYLKLLNLPLNLYLQYFNRHEFWTYININLTNFLEDFIKIIKNMNKNLYSLIIIEKLLNQVEIIDINKLHENKLFKLIFTTMQNHEINMLKFLILISKIYPDTLFIEVKNILLNHFKNFK